MELNRALLNDALSVAAWNLKENPDDGNLQQVFRNLATSRVDAFISRRYGNWMGGDSEACAADCVIKAIKHIANYDGKISYATYLYTITESICIDAWRKTSRRIEGREQRLSLSGIDYPGSEQNEEDMIFVKDIIALQSRMPSTNIIDALDNPSLLPHSLKALTVKQAFCLIYRIILDYSTAETAYLMRVSEGTVKSGLHDAKIKMKEMLEKDPWVNDVAYGCCDDVVPMLPGFCKGALQGRELVARHLPVCPDCTGRFKRMVAVGCNVNATDKFVGNAAMTQDELTEIMAHLILCPSCRSAVDIKMPNLAANNGV